MRAQRAADVGEQRGLRGLRGQCGRHG